MKQKIEQAALKAMSKFLFELATEGNIIKMCEQIKREIESLDSAISDVEVKAIIDNTIPKKFIINGKHESNDFYLSIDCAITTLS